MNFFRNKKYSNEVLPLAKPFVLIYIVFQEDKLPFSSFLETREIKLNSLWIKNRHILDNK
jgi:hypothetical protein